MFNICINKLFIFLIVFYNLITMSMCVCVFARKVKGDGVGYMNVRQNNLNIYHHRIDQSMRKKIK